MKHHEIMAIIAATMPGIAFSHDQVKLQPENPRMPKLITDADIDRFFKAQAKRDRKAERNLRNVK